jgi:hypothetical protein
VRVICAGEPNGTARHGYELSGTGSHELPEMGGYLALIADDHHVGRAVSPQHPLPR